MTALSTDRYEQEIEVLCAAYAAFNARDISTALSLMAPDVAWPKAFKGGCACGHAEVRTYWTEQWSEINPCVVPLAFYPENSDKLSVKVHQIVCNLDGAVLVDEHVVHCFTFARNLIQTMEVEPFPLRLEGKQSVDYIPN